MKEFLQSFIDEYDTNESCKSFFCKPSNVTHKAACICCNQYNIRGPKWVTHTKITAPSFWLPRGS